MKTILTLLLATLCAATSYGQTIKSLGFNSTNGQVIANTGTNALTFTNNVIFNNALYVSAVGFEGSLVFAAEDNAIFSSLSQPGESVATWETNSWRFRVPVQFNTTNIAATTRTNLGLPLEALTNTSNVTAMRALSGSTNTNHPFSGSVSVVGTNNTNTLVFSNGILQAVQ
jgi:hypothetical protein